MRYKLDLTGRKFLEMEYQFVSTAALEAPTQLGDSLEFLIYGFIWHSSEDFPELCERLPDRLKGTMPTVLFYAGWAKLSFKEVHGGSIRVHSYKPRFGPGDRQLMYHCNGEPMELRRDWPVSPGASGCDYVLECSLEQPFGAMRLTINASGPVTLSIDPNNFTLGDELGPNYDETRQRQLQSFE